MIKLPGLIDPHVHLREPGATHKEDWKSGTEAGVAGGFTMLLAMPNTTPPIIDKDTYQIAFQAANKKSLIDYGLFIGASPQNIYIAADMAPDVAGLKMYLDHTYGPLHLAHLTHWQEHIKNWPANYPICVHAEGRTLAAVLLIAVLYDKPIHVCHVARKEEIELIRAAKQKGVRVTCEVTPHHMFLTENDIPQDEPGKGEVRPRLGTTQDLEALWKNLEVIDCFASDHAPHTLAEKTSQDPPPGFPGLETSLYLYLTAVAERRLTVDDLILRMYTNPRKIFHLPRQSETWIEIDSEIVWEIKADNSYSRCGWTPFENWKVRGRLRRVVLRNDSIFINGELRTNPGSGRNIRRIVEPY